MELKTVSIDQLTISAHQRPISSAHVRALKQSLLVLGFLTPVIAVESESGFEVIDGQHRVSAAKELGITQIPIVIVPRDKLVDALLLLNIEKSDNIKDKSEKVYSLYHYPPLHPRPEKEVFAPLCQGYVPALAFAYKEKGVNSPALYEDVIRHFIFFTELTIEDAIPKRREEAQLIKTLDETVRTVSEAYSITDYVLKKAMLSQALKSKYGEKKGKRVTVTVTDAPETAISNLISELLSVNWSHLSSKGDRP